MRLNPEVGVTAPASYFLAGDVMAIWEEQGKTKVRCSNCGFVGFIDDCFIFRAGFAGITHKSAMDLNVIQCPKCYCVIDEDGEPHVSDIRCNHRAIVAAAAALIEMSRSEYGHSVRAIRLVHTPDGDNPWLMFVDNESRREHFGVNVPEAPRHKEVVRPDGA